jgi:hypothetical protein
MLDQLQTYAVQHQTLIAILVSTLAVVVAYFLALPREHASPILDGIPLVDISQVKKGQVEHGSLHEALSINCEKVRSWHTHRLKR